MERYYVATCQTNLPTPTDMGGIHRNVGRMLEMARYAVLDYEPLFAVKLVVFPEFAQVVPIFGTAEELYTRLAVPVPNEFTDRYWELAKELGIYIQTSSFLERDDKYPGHVFNTTCLIGPEGILLKYRKVHPWIPGEWQTSPHDIPNYNEPFFPVAETEIGRIGVAICYDWLFPEAIRQLALNGAEVLIRVSAYMDPWGTASPMEWWTLINRVRAIENLAYVVACNQGASLRNCPPYTWPGGSMIVDYDGRVLAQAEPGPGERIVVGPIDLAALRYERQRRRGHFMLGHLRTEAYDGYRNPIYPRGACPQPPSVSDIEQAIEVGRQRWQKIREKQA